MKRNKEYSPEQIANTKKLLDWLSNKPAEKRIPLEFAMKIYLDGMEAGMVYAQDTKASV